MLARWGIDHRFLQAPTEAEMKLRSMLQLPSHSTSALCPHQQQRKGRGRICYSVAISLAGPEPQMQRYVSSQNDRVKIEKTHAKWNILAFSAAVTAGCSAVGHLWRADGVPSGMASICLGVMLPARGCSRSPSCMQAPSAI